MLLLNLVMCLLMLGSADPLKLTGAGRLQSDSAPSAPLPTSRETADVNATIAHIRESHEKDQLGCVSALLALWAEGDYQDAVVPLDACQLATDPAAIERILQTVQGSAERAHTKEQREGIRCFFGAPARVLCAKMSAPEPLLRLAVQCKAWDAILDWDCPQDLRQKYVLQGLAQCASEQCCPRIGSVRSTLSVTDIPALRQIVRQLRTSASQCEGLYTALATLVDFEDVEIVPDLENLVKDQTLHPWQRSRLRLYLLKLKNQHSLEGLVSIVRNEREDYHVLVWAVKRLLWLKTDKETIYEALSANQEQAGPDGFAAALAKTMRRLEGPQAFGGLADMHLYVGDVLLLDGKELGEHYAESRRLAKDKDSQEMMRRTVNLSLKSLLNPAPSRTASAPSGE